MKKEDIKALTVEELESEIKKQKDSYQKLKFAHAISQIENPSQISTQRKLIARLSTELTSKLKATK